jgi:hypothetical protein
VKISSCSARHRRSVFVIGCLLSLPYSQILMIIPMLQFLLWLALGALIVIHRSVRLNSGTQYE